MKKVWLSLFVIVSLFGLTACRRAIPDAGNEAVLIKKPMFFGHGGVVPEAVTTGSEWCVCTTDIVYFTYTPTQYKESFDDLITDDNNPVDFDVYVELQMEKGKSPILLEKFQVEFYQNNISPFIRRVVRDEASKYKMFDLAADSRVTDAIQAKLKEELTAFVLAKGIPINVNNVMMGKVKPPDEVLAETTKTAAQVQAIKTQNARADAERARGEAEKQKAIADDMYKNTFGMTTGEYLSLRKLEIEKEKIELIRDKQQVTVILSEGGGLPTTYPVK